MARRGQRRTIAAFVVVAAVAGGATVALRRGGEDELVVPWVVSPIRQPLIQTVTATGNATVESPRTVGFAVPGRLVSVGVTTGSTVQVGDVLGRLDDRSASLAIETARANLALAEARTLAVRDGRTPAEQVRDQRLIDQARDAAAAAAAAEVAGRRSARATVEQAEEAVTRAVAQGAREASSEQVIRSQHEEAGARFERARSERDSVTLLRDTALADRDAAATERDRRRAAADDLAARVAVLQGTLQRAQGDLDATQTREQRALEDAQAVYERARIEAENLRVAAGEGGVIVGLPSSAALDQTRRAGAEAVASAQRVVLGATADVTAANERQLEAGRVADEALRQFDLKERSLGEVSLRLDRLRGEYATAEALERDLRSQLRLAVEASARAQDATSAAERDRLVVEAAAARTMEDAAAARSGAAANRRVQEAGAGVAAQAPRRGEVLAADAAVAAAKVAVALAEHDRDQLTLRAPTAGTVLAVSGRVGEQVAPGAPYVTLGDTSSLVVRVGFAEVDSVKVRAGQRATVRFDSLPDREVTGVVASVEPTASTVNNVVITYVRIAVEKMPPAVRAGSTGVVRVATATLPDSLTVPAGALVQREAGTYLQRWNGSEIEEAPVRIGERVGGTVQVLSGLSPSALVMVPEGTPGASRANASAASAASAVSAGVASTTRVNREAR